MENNILVIGPIVAPLVGAALCLIIANFNRAQRLVALASQTVGWLASVGVLYANWDEGPQIYRLGNWQPPFGIAFVPDMLSALFGVMATTVVTGGILYAVTCRDKSLKRPAFMPLFLSMGAGLSGALYTGDIFTLFVFLELMVISSVGLVAISDNKLGLEAAIKYLLISSMGTLFLLLGIAAMYTSFGTLNMADMARQLVSGQRPLLAEASGVMLMSAFLVKSAVFPFHFWQPDFHTTAPTPVHAVLSSVVVKVGVYGLIRLTTLLFVEEAELIETLLIILGLIGIFFGSLGALQTYDAKRMLAYSTFGQIGFILVAIGWGTPVAFLAAIVYAVNHAFIKSSLLMLTGVVSSRMASKSSAVANIGGVGKGMVLTSILYLLGGLALAGVPPLNGFISKVALVQGGIDAGDWWSLGLVVGAGMITMLYMVRTWQLIFQRSPDGPLEYREGGGDNPLAPAILISICVLLGIYATPLIDLAEETVDQISRPENYICTVFPEETFVLDDESVTEGEGGLISCRFFLSQRDAPRDVARGE